MMIAEFDAACCAAMPLPRANDFVLKELLRSIRVLCRTLFGSDYVGLLAKAAETAVLALRAPSTSRSGDDFLSFRPRVGEKTRWRSAQLPRRARAAIGLGCG